MSTDLAERMRQASEASMSVRPPGERLLFWLGQAALRAREEADLKPATIASTLGRREATIENFEKGLHMPQDLEAVLAVYAEACGLDDARDLVRDALRLWYEHGEAPSQNGDSAED
jgi:hypothetical protein